MNTSTNTAPPKLLLHPAWITDFGHQTHDISDIETSGKMFFQGATRSFICYSTTLKIPLWQQKSNLFVLVRQGENIFSFSRKNDCIFIDKMVMPEQPIPMTFGEHIYRYNSDGELAHHLDHLLTMISSLCRPLQQFIQGVLLDERIAPGFFNNQASINHHHSHKGGLFIHSLECAMMVSMMARTWMNKVEADIAIVAALLHDIGKTRTFSQSGNWSNAGHYTHHEAITLEILAPHLQMLEATWPTGANTLRHALSWRSHSHKFPAFPGTHLVHMCDQFSTALNIRNLTFAESPQWHRHAWRFDNRQHFIRIPPNKQ